MQTLFVAGNPGGDFRDLNWTLEQSEPKFSYAYAASEGATLGFNYVFNPALSGPEEAAVLALIADPQAWFPVGSYTVTGLPGGGVPGKDIAWVRDAVREGGGTGTHAFYDGTNWRRMSDNVIVST